MKRRQFLKLFAATITATISTPGFAYIESQRFDVNHYKFKIKNLQKPIRVAHLTDLHFGRWHTSKQVRVWVNATLREKPDLIVITGDIVDSRRSMKKLDELGTELSRLKAPLGVFAVPGNHDFAVIWHIGMDGYTKWLKNLGIKLLVNNGEYVREDFFLSGMDDFWLGKPNLLNTLQNHKKDTANILLCHNPDMLPKIPTSVNLTLCGHTHGGQIRAPFGISLYSISKYGERFQMGFVKGDLGANAFVSRGLGTTGPPLRTFCSAELVILELHP